MSGAVGLGVAARAAAVSPAPSPRAGAETFALLLPTAHPADDGETAPAAARTGDLADTAVDLAKESAAALLAVATWPQPASAPAPDPAGATTKPSPTASTATSPSITIALVDASRTLAQASPTVVPRGLPPATRQAWLPIAPSACFTAEPPAGTPSGTQAAPQAALQAGMQVDAAAMPVTGGDSIVPTFAAAVFAQDVAAAPADLPTGPPRLCNERTSRLSDAPTAAPHVSRTHRSPVGNAAAATDAPVAVPAIIPPDATTTADATTSDAAAGAAAGAATDDTAAAAAAVTSSAMRDIPLRGDPSPAMSSAEARMPPPTPPPPQQHPAAPPPVVHSPQFGDAFGAHVTWLAEQRAGEAQIRVSPDELGPIDIRLRFDGDTVRADFGSEHAEVRAVIEAQLPRLRELLSAQGLELAGAEVGSNLGNASSRPQPARPASTDGPGDAATPAVEPGRVGRAVRGLFDAYA